QVRADGNGTITLIGTGIGTEEGSSTDTGVVISGQVTTVNGNLSITGLSQGGVGPNNNGILLALGSTVRAGGQGDLTLNGTTGSQFLLLNNDGTTDGNATFAQGSSVVIDGQPFAINYAGDDGNNVVLTALPPAGVTITPTTGLVTTESGGTATFSVVLTSQPT